MDYAKQAKFYYYEFRKPLPIALIIAVLSWHYFANYFPGNCITLLSDLNDRIWNYGLTIVAFQIAAYTLLYSATDREHFRKLKKTRPFRNTIKIFKLAIGFHMVIILVSFSLDVIGSVKAGILASYYPGLIGFLVFLFTLGVSLVWKVIDLLHILLTTDPVSEIDSGKNGPET